MQACRSASHSGQVVRRPTGPSIAERGPAAVAGRRPSAYHSPGSPGRFMRKPIPLRPLHCSSSASRSAGWPRCSWRCGATTRPATALRGEADPAHARRGRASFITMFLDEARLGRAARPPGHRAASTSWGSTAGATTSRWSTSPAATCARSCVAPARPGERVAPGAARRRTSAARVADALDHAHRKRGARRRRRCGWSTATSRPRTCCSASTARCASSTSGSRRRRPAHAPRGHRAARASSAT